MRSVEELYRSRNVRVFRLDRERVVARLKERARTLLEQRPDVLEVRLHGSLARGDATPGSDADIFVLVRDGAGPFLDRIPELARHFTGTGIGCDVIAYTETELATNDDRFTRTVLREGMPLAVREERPQRELQP